MNDKNKIKHKIGATIGTVCVDLGKLSFGSLILGAVLRGSLNPLQILLFGAGIAVVLFTVGITLIVLNKE